MVYEKTQRIMMIDAATDALELRITETFIIRKALLPNDQAAIDRRTILIETII